MSSPPVINVTYRCSLSALEFITMPLESGIVLPGITRESIIEMINDHASGKKDFPVPGLPKNIRIVERDFSMPEVLESLKEGSCKGCVPLLVANTN